MPIEKFTTEDYNALEDALLEYVNAVAEVYAPDFAFDADGMAYPTESQAPRIFRIRYNKGFLTGGFSYEDYTRSKRAEENIIDIIEALGIDVEKFWYLLLFVHDYVMGSTVDTQRFSKSPRQEMEELVEFVGKNELGFDFSGRMKFSVPMTLMLKVRGRKLEISNPTTISLIAHACKESIKEIHLMSVFNSMAADGRYTTSPTVRIWLFAKMLRTFFEKYPQFTGKKRSNSESSKSTHLLISKLAYFVGLTQNEDYSTNDENIKAIIRQYRDHDLDTMNKIYG